MPKSKGLRLVIHKDSFVKIFVFIFLLAACAPTTTPAPKTQIINVYATSAAQPWLLDAFSCAPHEAVIRVANSPADADISMRLGEPEFLTVPAYRIDTEEILIVTHRQSPLQNMTLEEVRELFAGQGDSPVQVWVYAEGEDVQGVFEQAVMQGRSVTSLARLGVSPQQMSDIVNKEQNTVGILPRRWKVGDSRMIFSIPNVPVLALVNNEPQGVVREVVACLQKLRGHHERNSHQPAHPFVRDLESCRPFKLERATWDGIWVPWSERLRKNDHHPPAAGLTGPRRW